jgi:acetyl/propionyl-CoA carboxylase alpha subunit
MSFQLRLNGKTATINVAARRPHLRLTIDGIAHDIAVGPVQDGAFEIAVDGHVWHGWRFVAASEIFVRLAGRTFVFETVTASDRGPGTDVSDEVRADMPGTVVAVYAVAGATVEKGDRLLLIESMKLQMTITAPRGGTVERMHTAVGSTFDRGATLVSFAPLTDVCAPQGG